MSKDLTKRKHNFTFVYDCLTYVYHDVILTGNELVSRQSGKVTFPNSARSGSGGSQRLLKSSNSGKLFNFTLDQLL